ncbi:MAG: PAS domain S-box protein [Bacteroidetes bacterium]|nr:PAS domain S-box protein [Bacteroidota bacterium]
MNFALNPPEGVIGFEELMNRIVDGVVALDTKGVCTYLNPTAISVLSKYNLDILGKNILDEFHLIENQEFYRAIQKAQETQKAHFLEDYYPTYNKWYHFSIYPSTTGTTLIVKEITDQKKVWNPVFETDKKYQILFDKNPIPMWAVDIKSLSFIDVNQAAVNHYGYSREEFLSMTSFDIRPEEEWENFKQHVKQTNDQESYSGIWKHQKKDGSIIFAEIYYHTVVLHERRIRLVLSIDVTEEILVKQKLKSSEQRFRALVEGSENAIFIVDENGKNLEVNHSATSLLGYSESVLKSFNIMQLFDCTDEQKVIWFDIFRNGTTGLTLKNLICHDGTIVPVEVAGTKLPDGRIIFTIKNISEKIRNENEIRKSNERFNYVLKATNDGVWEANLKTGEAWWSDHLYAMLKYKPGEFPMDAATFESLIHPDDRARVMNGLANTLKSDSPFWSDEFRGRCSDGSYGIYYDRAYILRNEKGEPEKMIGTAMDLTGLKKYETDLAESENRLRTIVQSEPECIKTVDANGIILEMNPAGMEILEASNASQVVGKRVLDIINENYRKAYAESSELVFLGQSFKQEFEITTLRGNRKWVESHVVPLRNSTGEITSSLAISRDITANKKAEQEMILMNERLRLLSSHLLNVREDERTLIAREIHDELGQQLTSLKIDLSWLRKKLPNADHQVDDKVQSMISLIDDTVKSVRRISTELRPGILDDLGLIAALEWQSQEFEKRTGIKTDFSTSIGEEGYDKSMATGIFRVFQESLTNIARHSGATKVKSSLLQKNGTITLSVRDNGQGFDKNKLKTIKTLGLMGMQERAMMMGGDLKIDSGDGTQIVLIVPIQKQS